MIVLRVFAVLFAASALWPAAPAFGHDSRPLMIMITENSGGALRLSWKAPPSIAPNTIPRVSIDACRPLQESGDGRQRQGLAVYSCPDGLAAKSVVIDYALYNPSISTLIRVQFASGETRSALLDPAQTQWPIPAPESFAGVAASYFIIGGKHILGGIDHLLFLAALVYIARTPRRIAVAVTGFTLAHSATIVLVALDAVAVSVPAVEALIALSVVFLASEIARDNRETLTWRRPILAAAGFGLVHGAGFAAALSEIGLPQTEKIGALMFFNLGVEAGQLAMIGAALAISRMAVAASRSLSFRIEGDASRLAFSYALGILSASWFLDRLARALA